jgi:hypothetical protein
MSPVARASRSCSTESAGRADRQAPAVRATTLPARCTDTLSASRMKVILSPSLRPNARRISTGIVVCPFRVRTVLISFIRFSLQSTTFTNMVVLSYRKKEWLSRGKSLMSQRQRPPTNNRPGQYAQYLWAAGEAALLVKITFARCICLPDLLQYS